MVNNFILFYFFPALLSKTLSEQTYFYCVRNHVEGFLHIHSYSTGAGHYMKFSLFVSIIIMKNALPSPFSLSSPISVSLCQCHFSLLSNIYSLSQQKTLFCTYSISSQIKSACPLRSKSNTFTFIYPDRIGR